MYKNIIENMMLYTRTYRSMFIITRDYEYIMNLHIDARIYIYAVDINKDYNIYKIHLMELHDVRNDKLKVVSDPYKYFVGLTK